VSSMPPTTSTAGCAPRLAIAVRRLATTSFPDLQLKYF